MISNGVLGVGMSVRAGGPDFKDFASYLDLAEPLGVEFVEIPVVAMDLAVAGKIMPERIRQLKKLLCERPFRYTVHGPMAINLMDLAERLVHHEMLLDVSLQVAAELGALHYVLHSGITAQDDTSAAETAYARQRDRLSKAGDRARSLGIIIAVENIYAPAQQSTALPSRLAKELAIVDHSHVKACLDFSHGFINAKMQGADFLAEVRALAPFAKHLHIHDSFGQPDQIATHFPSERLALGHGDLHLPVGWGSIPWDLLIEECRFLTGAIFNVELEQRYWSELGTTVAATRRLAARARCGDG